MWCGSCGAHVVGDEDPADPDDGDDAAVTAPGPSSRWVALAAAVALVGAVAAVGLLRSSPPEPLLGRVGTRTGVTADGMPPAGLEVVWEHDLGEHNGAFPINGPAIVADGDRLRVGGVVLDRSTGRLVRASPTAVVAERLRHATLTGDELVVSSTLTGQVRSRTRLDGERPEGRCCRPVVQAGDGWLLSSDRESVLVADDGTEVTRVGAVPMDFMDSADADAAAVPLRGPPLGPEARLVLVDPFEGGVIHEVDDGRARVAQVVGEVALLASPATGPLAENRVNDWTLELLDATSGVEMSRYVIASEQAPQLLGFTHDGRVVIGVRLGSEVQLHTAARGGLTLQTAVQVPETQHARGVLMPSTVRATVGIDDGVLVTIDGDEVRAEEIDGAVRWRRDLGDARRLAVGDGYVALGDGPDSAGGTVRVLDLADGTSVATFPDEIDSRLLSGDGRQPLSVVDGHVGLGDGSRVSPGNALPVGSSVWLELRTGARVAAGELLEPLVGDALDEPTTDEWWLHGLLDDGTPLVTSGLQDSRVRVVQPGRGSTTVEVPSPGPSDGYAELTGVSADAVAVSEHVFDDGDGARHTMHLLGLRDGHVTTEVGLLGGLLAGDLLLATDLHGAPGRGGNLVAIDATTGRRRWSTAWARGEVRDRARFDDSLLVAGDAFGVTAVRLEDGGTAWDHVADEELAQPLVLAGSSVLVATTTGEVVALARESGAELWRSAVGTPVASLAGAGEGVVVGTFDGHVIVLDGTGREVQRIGLVDRRPVGAVAALGETVVATTGSRVVGLRADGRLAPPPGEVLVP